jgi:hypothetical protein
MVLTNWMINGVSWRADSMPERLRDWSDQRVFQKPLLIDRDKSLNQHVPRCPKLSFRNQMILLKKCRKKRIRSLMAPDFSVRFAFGHAHFRFAFS